MVCWSRACAKLEIEVVSAISFPPSKTVMNPPCDEVIGYVNLSFTLFWISLVYEIVYQLLYDNVASHCNSLCGFSLHGK